MPKQQARHRWQHALVYARADGIRPIRPRAHDEQHRHAPKCHYHAPFHLLPCLIRVDVLIDVAILANSP